MMTAWLGPPCSMNLRTTRTGNSSAARPARDRAWVRALGAAMSFAEFTLAQVGARAWPRDTAWPSPPAIGARASAGRGDRLDLADVLVVRLRRRDGDRHRDARVNGLVVGTVGVVPVQVDRYLVLLRGGDVVEAVGAVLLRDHLVAVGGQLRVLAAR